MRGLRPRDIAQGQSRENLEPQLLSYPITRLPDYSIHRSFVAVMSPSTMWKMRGIDLFRLQVDRDVVGVRIGVESPQSREIGPARHAGAGAFRFGVPSGVRGMPGVCSLIHWASAAAAESSSAAKARLEKRDIDGTPLFEYGLIRRYLNISVRL